MGVKKAIINITKIHSTSKLIWAQKKQAIINNKIEVLINLRHLKAAYPKKKV